MGRRRIEVIGPEPTDHASCDFRSYPGMENYVFGHHKSEDGTNKDIWLFSSSTLLAFLSRCKVAGLDCTFKMTPKMWYQTAVFLVFANGFWIPTCWFLLPNKEAFTYEVMCGLLQNALEKNNLDLKG